MLCLSLYFSPKTKMSPRYVLQSYHTVENQFCTDLCICSHIRRRNISVNSNQIILSAASVTQNFGQWLTWHGSSKFPEEKCINSSSAENPMKKRELEELKQIERHFKDEKIYFKQLIFLVTIWIAFFEQEINKTPAWKTPKKWLKRKLKKSKCQRKWLKRKAYHHLRSEESNLKAKIKLE